jgi:hypothetical protein
MKGLSIVKRFAVAAVAAAALAGPVTAAHALQFSSGDAVLAVYGNSTEYVANLGSMSTLLSSGANIDLTSILGSIGPTSSLKYTIVGYNGSTITFGDGSALSSWSSTGPGGGDKGKVNATTFISALSNWSGGLVTSGNTLNLFSQGDANSFSSNLNAAGSDTLGGSVPSTRKGMATIDNYLYLLQGTSGPNLSQVGTALLSSSTGHLVVSAVPVPAAVVLFATGVIGLVGLARRRMSGAQPDAA